MIILPPPIPRVIPYYIGNAKDSGRTTPIEMRCLTPNGQEDYIVKLWGNPELHLGKQALANEVYGSLLAKSLGIATPDISLVEIPNNFFISSPPHLSDLIRNSPGLNFGSKYLSGTFIFSPPVPQSKHACAIRVFCFDMLICNYDRTIAKPNTFQTNENYIIFDHEQAFPYCRPGMIVGGIGHLWNHIKEPWHKNHIFYQDLKHSDNLLEIEAFIETLGFISSEFLDTIEEQIPEEWHSENDLGNIRHILLDTVQNLDQFKRSLQEILA